MSWTVDVTRHADLGNLDHLGRAAESLVNRVREAIGDGFVLTDAQLGEYQDLVFYHLYHAFRESLAHLMATRSTRASSKVDFWAEFQRQFDHYLAIPGCQLPTQYDPAHILACFFQLRRAFHYVFHCIVGTSRPISDLRAAVWQSVFTHDMRRYRRCLFDRMCNLTTLIVGPSGTGKELVARAIGVSGYIPFDVESRRFVSEYRQSFRAVNLSTLSSGLIESELFGHCRGAFTGALHDKKGWLESCDPHGTVFLDEIGELDVAVQVKLLRLLQTRTFQRLGDTDERQFEGKIAAATNRDLAGEMRAGRFRSDFYYRLCSDIVTTPSLECQLRDTPEDLAQLVQFISHRTVGDEAEQLTGEVLEWIETHLPADYAWPGNVRELEQCVHNILVRRRYSPAEASPDDPSGIYQRIAQQLAAGELTMEQFAGKYCTLVYALTGSYEKSASRLHIDRRTVKSKIDAELLAQLQNSPIHDHE